MLVVDRYTTAGILDCMVEGATPVAVYMSMIERWQVAMEGAGPRSQAQAGLSLTLDRTRRVPRPELSGRRPCP